MKKIYIILMHTNTVPSKFVKFFTRYEYSHVGISLEKNCDVIYSFGRKKLESILNGGFTVEHKNGEFFNKFNKTMCKIFEIEISDSQYNEVKDIMDDMELNRDDYKYDLIGIVPRFFGIALTLKNRYVCSYFVASVLENTNICNFDKDACMVIPRDFEKVQGLNEIYSGSYKMYQI